MNVYPILSEVYLACVMVVVLLYSTTAWPQSDKMSLFQTLWLHELNSVNKLAQDFNHNHST